MRNGKFRHLVCYDDNSESNFALQIVYYQYLLLFEPRYANFV